MTTDGSRDRVNPEIGRDGSKLDQAIDFAKYNFKYLLLLIPAYLIAQHLGWAPTIDIKLWHILAVVSSVAGWLFGKLVAEHYGPDWFGDWVEYLLDTGKGLADILEVPRDTSAEYDVHGDTDRLPATDSLAGKTRKRIRGIDTKNKTFIPGGTFIDDDRYPNDGIILAQDGDLRAVLKHEKMLREDAELWHMQRVSEDTLKIKAKGDALDDISLAFQELGFQRDETEELEQGETVEHESDGGEDDE
jgi:hypothetical protein